MSETETLPVRVSDQFVTLLNAGAGRGAAANVTYLREFNERSTRFRIRPVWIDPVPDKARTLAEQAAVAGLAGGWREASIQDCLSDVRDNLVILNLDQPSALAAAFATAAERDAPVLGYLLIRMPNDELFGIRTLAQRHERDVKRRFSKVFDKLATVTARRGSVDVTGERALPGHRIAEPSIRNWFGQHVKSNLPKLLAGLEPEATPFEITRDGHATVPVIIRMNPHWGSALEMLAEIERNPPMPMRGGEDFAILETGPDGVRFHHARKRKTDGQVALRGTTGLDPSSLEYAKQREDHAFRILHGNFLTRTLAALTGD